MKERERQEKELDKQVANSNNFYNSFFLKELQEKE